MGFGEDEICRRRVLRERQEAAFIANERDGFVGDLLGDGGALS
jgi:hypothetical protein